MEEIKPNKSKGQIFKVLCVKCRQETSHRVLQSIDTDGHEDITSDFDGDFIDTVAWRNHYQIVRCSGCESFSFRHQNWSSETNDDGVTIELYPQRSQEMLVAETFYHLPKNLRTLYREIISCFNNGSPLLCAAGLRAIIEGLCVANGVTGGDVEIENQNGTSTVKRMKNIVGKINGLYEKEFLTKNQAAILHKLRLMGNDAIHELSEPSAEDLRIAIDIAEHTLKSLYEIPKQANALEKSRHEKDS